jgi:hypothetical protein
LGLQVAPLDRYIGKVRQSITTFLLDICVWVAVRERNIHHFSLVRWLWPFNEGATRRTIEKSERGEKQSRKDIPKWCTSNIGSHHRIPKPGNAQLGLSP